MYRSLRAMALFTLFSACLFVGLVIYWMTFPLHDPVVTGPTPYRIVHPATHVVEQGSYITYEFDYVKRTDIIPVVHRRFVDGLVFDVADQTPPVLTKTGRGTARVQIHVPETLPPGTYHLEIDAQYQLNPIRHYNNNNKTETFRVIQPRRLSAEGEGDC